MSSAQFEEAGHKLMKIQLAQGQEIEVVTMLIECCSQEKTYIRWVPATCTERYDASHILVQCPRCSDCAYTACSVCLAVLAEQLNANSDFACKAGMT